MTSQTIFLARCVLWVLIAILVSVALYFGPLHSGENAMSDAAVLSNGERPALTPSAGILTAIDQVASQMPSGWAPQAWDVGAFPRENVIYGVDWESWLATTNPGTLTESYINRYAGRPVTMLTGSWQVVGAYNIEKPFAGVALEVIPNTPHTGGVIRGVLLFRSAGQPISEVRQALFTGKTIAFAASLIPIGLEQNAEKNSTNIVLVPILNVAFRFPAPLDKLENELLTSKAVMKEQFNQRRNRASSTEEVERLKKDYEAAQAAGLL